MTDIRVRAAAQTDIPALVALNADVVDVTSPMDAARCAELVAMSYACLVATRDSELIGFVLVMRDGAAYDSPNYQWFAERLVQFAYVDRIVIGPQARGLGLGARLYAQVIEDAKATGCLTLAAEMDCEPPNLPSLAFHKAQGFVEIGTRRYPAGKQVSMQIKGLTG